MPTLSDLPGDRSPAAARRRVLTLLKDDHRQLAAAFAEFDRRVADAGHAFVGRLVADTLDLLEAHAAIEHELVYRALAALDDRREPVLEAEVAHTAMAALAAQLRAGGESDPKFVARVKVLGEYLRHHVQEEETVLFAALEKRSVDWTTLAGRVAARRAQLLGD